MPHSADIDLNMYTPQFSVQEAHELTLNFLTTLEADKPDSKSLLILISDLTAMINTAKFDYSVLQNLMLENALLIEERDELQLQQIAQNVAHMGVRVNAINVKCEGLQTKLNALENSDFKLGFPEPINPGSDKAASEGFNIPDYDPADFTINLKVRG